MKPFSERELVGTLRSALASYTTEEEDYHLRVLIEQLVRRNYSEWEIMKAVRDASRQPLDRSERVGWLGRLLGRGKPQ